MWSEPSGSDDDDVIISSEPITHIDRDYRRSYCCMKCPPNSVKDWTWHHLVVFLLTFFSYALFHATRKTFSNVKPDISEDWRPVDGKTQQNSSSQAILSNQTGAGHDLFLTKREAETFLGVLDTVFLSSYAVGLYISGIIGDRFNPRLVLSAGMVISAITTFMFGCLPTYFGFYSMPYYIIIWGLNGLAQSSGWPTEVAIMGSWFGHSGRGFVLGLWSACASIGNIIGAELSARVVDYGYEYAFLVSSGCLFCGGVVIFFALVPSPMDLGLHDNDIEESLEKELTERPEAISFWKAVLLPGVIAYSLAYACLKLVNYSFFFWLPYYLNDNFDWSTSVSDELSTYYDWGGIVGGIVGGVVSDWMNCRTPVVVGMLLLSEFALFGYSRSPNNKTWNMVLMTITGFFIGGPANLISAAISADLGKQPQVAGSSSALATVTGLVDGTGSVGAAMGQILVPVIQNKISWHAVFYWFIIMCFVTCLCLLKLCYKDTKNIVDRCRGRDSDIQYSPLPAGENEALLDD